MNHQKQFLVVLCALLVSLGVAHAQNLINVRVSGANPGTPTGAAVLGESGDVWNYFPNLSGRASGGGVVTNATTIKDSSGATLPGVAMTMSLSGGNGLDNYTDNTSYNPTPVVIMGNYIYETDGLNYWTFTFTGLLADTAYVLYGMGNGNADGQGTTWWVDTVNGHATASATANFSSGDRNATLASNEGICWVKLAATTTSSGELTFRVVRLGAAENGTGGSGRAYLNGFQLQPLVAPVITGLTNQTVAAGTTVVLNPDVSGTPAPSLQWLSNNVALSGETNAMLVLANVQYAQDGTVYSLVASNSYGAVTNGMTLTVLEPIAPVFTMQPADHVAGVGEPVMFTAEATGLPEPALQWRKNGTNIAGATGATLVLDDVQVGDSGVYSVTASNSVGTATSSNATLTVTAPNGFCTVNGTTTGGAGGPVVTVTNGTDFISQATANGSRIIQVQGVLTIGVVSVKSDKTILGLGTNATLLGRLSLSGVSNVIIRNLRMTDPGDDGITIRDANTHHFWVDHVTFYDCGDGACDISQGADYVTVSWCRFLYPTQQEHRFTMIADGTASGQGHITLHHNWWSTRSDQRMAATSYGRIHYYNNYFNCTNNYYCSNARTDAELNIENNYYAGVRNPVTVSAGTNGKIKTSGNLYPGCKDTIYPGTDTVFTPPYAYTLDATVDVPALVKAGAGAPGPDTAPIPAKVWDGGGGNNNLGTANNWGANEAPREYDVLTFAGSTRLTPYNNFTGGTEFPTLIFSNNAGAFALGGNTLNLGAGITDDSSAIQTLNLSLDFTYASDHFSMNREFNVTQPNGSLVLNGNIIGFGNAYDKPYTVTKLGPGLLTLTGANSFPGTLRFNDGLVRFSTPGNLGTTNLTFDGGGLQWASGNTTDISPLPVTIQAGGAMLDVGPNNVSFANPVGVGSAGGMTKLGAGTLELNGNNPFSGPTRVAQGTLALGTAGGLPNTPQLILTNDATLDVSGRADGTLTLGNGQTLVGHGNIVGSVTASSGSASSPGFSIGTLTVSGALTLLAGSTSVMELDGSAATNDLLTGMTSVHYGGSLVLSNLGGTLTAGDSFRLFSAGSYAGSFSTIQWPLLDAGLAWTNRLAADGTIAVVSMVNPTPTNIVASVVGGSLQLWWPPDHTGWRLEAQTNNLEAGLSTNWTSLGYATTNSAGFPIDPANGNVFYRLVYP